MLSVSMDLEKTVSDASEQLLHMSDDAAGRPLAPGKWSPKEVIGHLIDSASNNHQRFVRARFQDNLVFPGYQQDDWVLVQQYKSASWKDLINLWKSFNLHIARYIALIPRDIYTRSCTVHNLNEVSWEKPSSDQPVTLEFLPRDYLNHLKHHLRQIDEKLAGAPVLQFLPK